MADYTFTTGKELKLHGKDTEFFHYWDFGDGTPISNAQNPTHIYSTTGFYTINHWAQSPCGTCTIKTHTVEIVTILPGPGIADFEFALGEEVYFNRKDTELAHAWNFGDGSPISNLPSPTHIYSTQGIYTITHTAQNSCDTCIAITKTIEIVMVCAAPVCDFIVM